MKTKYRNHLSPKQWAEYVMAKDNISPDQLAKRIGRWMNQPKEEHRKYLNLTVRQYKEREDFLAAVVRAILR